MSFNFFFNSLKQWDNKYTVDGFIFVGTTFRGLNKNYTFVCVGGGGGSKFVAKAFPFIIHTENSFFVGTRFCGSDPPEKPQKLVPHEN